MSTGLQQLNNAPLNQNLHVGGNQGPGNVGGQQVGVGNGPTLGQRISAKFSEIRQGFVSLGDRISTYFENKAAARRQSQADSAADKFARAFGNGTPSDKKATELVATLMRRAERLNPGNGGTQADTLILQAYSRLTPGQQQQFDATNWTNVRDNVNTRIDYVTQRAHNIMVGLDAIHGGGQNAPQQAPTNPLKGLSTTLFNNCNGGNAQRVQARMPPGVTVDPHGNLAGTTTITTIPRGMPGIPPELHGQTFESMFQNSASNKLQTGTVPYNNMTVASHVSGDFYRMDFDIPLPNHQRFQSSQDPTKEADQRSKNALNALSQFAGGPNETKVLSCLLGQTTLHSFARSAFAKTDGSHAPYKLLTAMNSGGTNWTIKDNQGNLNPVNNILGIGAAKWNLSHEPNGDYRISIDWNTVYTTDPNDPHTLPLHQDGTIGVRYQLDFIVDRNQAQQGNLSFTMPNGIQATFSGALQV